MKRLPKILIIILHILSVQISFAQSINETHLNNLTKTYGFLLGQRLSLNNIKASYPSLFFQVEKAESEFKISFGLAEKNIEKSLKDIMKHEYQVFNSTIRKKIKTAIISQKITNEIALSFVNEVESRAKGNIESPIIETLLHYQFIDNPYKEFSKGFVNTYRTKGHPKSKGLDFQIEYPKSWAKREGKRPNIIQFFFNDKDLTRPSALIMVRDLVQESPNDFTLEDISALNTYEGSDALASEVFSEENLRDMTNVMNISNVQNLKTKRIIIDNWPGAIIEFTGEIQRLDKTFISYYRIYMSIYKNYLINVHFQLGTLTNKNNLLLKKKITKYSTLFEQMANSLVIQNQYKRNDTNYSDKNIFESTKHNFKIKFPNDVETVDIGMAEAFTSFEINDNKIIFYQVNVMSESYNQPIIYKNKRATDNFLKATIKELSQLRYKNTKDFSTSAFLFNNQYHSMNYKFHGQWDELDGLVVYTKGMFIARKERLYKITVIYTKDWHGTKEIETKTNNFIDSFIFTDGK